jgi:cysteinyl-tRNA synthetase
MSKSLGNFVLVHDIRQQIDPQVLRFFMLSVHYRHPINFAQDLVEAAKSGLERLRSAYSNVQHRLAASANLSDNGDDYLTQIQEVKKQFETAMDDDFNTANAISALFELARVANTYLNESNTEERVLKEFIETFDTLGDVLGIVFGGEGEILDEEIETLIEERNTARKNRDFARSDEIRDQLLSMNIILEDTRQGTRWKRGL